MTLSIGAIERPEKKAIQPMDETHAFPSPLAEWIEPAEYLAKTIYGEANTLDRTQQAAVVWCVLNRVDAGWGTVIECVTAPEQFRGYMRTNPVTKDQLFLSLDVLARWQAEQHGLEDVGRVLPREYLYFSENKGVNEFRVSYYDYRYCWDWSLESPYE